MTRVKVCCISSVEEARRARGAGVAALGLVSAMPSGPGVIGDALIAEIAAAMAVGTMPATGTAEATPRHEIDAGEPVGRDGAIRTFLLTSRTTAEAIATQHAAAGTTTLQLVDHVPHAELQRLRLLCPGVELVQVIHVTGPGAVAEAVAVAPWVDAVLLDSGNPALAVKELGGTGRRHDWSLSRRIRDAVYPLPLWLAGGLRAANVGEAISTVRPHGLDICTGVRRDGRLDTALLEAFMQAVAAAEQDPAIAPAATSLTGRSSG